MGKATGFMEYKRVCASSAAPLERIKNFEDFHGTLSEADRRRQSSRCMDCGVPFCQAGIDFDGRLLGCPLHNLIPEWNDALYLENYNHALARLLLTNCFPEFTGRICPAPCEAACTCGINGDPVTVRDNELFISDFAYSTGLMAPQPPSSRSGKRVAVIGSGPAGLAAAYLLNKRGHEVTVFERDDRPGGLLMYGIPNMKLPKYVLERRVANMTAEGVIFKTDTDVGKDISAKEILDGYDCVILCCGAKEPRQLTFEGKAANGVVYAVDYLKASTKQLLGSALPDDAPSAKGKDVLVIGAGDSASDCVATAIRQGCSSLTQVIRKPRSYYPDTMDYASEEAMAVYGCDVRRFDTQVKQLFSDENGKLNSARITSGDTEELIKTDLLIIASGFEGCEEYVCSAFGIERTKKGNASADSSGRTSAKNIFVAGDMRRGQSLVVWAIAEGRAAAREADLSLMGYTNIK